MQWLPFEAAIDLELYFQFLYATAKQTGISSRVSISVFNISRSTQKIFETIHILFFYSFPPSEHKNGPPNFLSFLFSTHIHQCSGVAPAGGPPFPREPDPGQPHGERRRQRGRQQPGRRRRRRGEQQQVQPHPRPVVPAPSQGKREE